MSVELVNDCVILPNHPNWKDSARWRRTWNTSIVPGLTAAEDKLTGRSQPNVRLDYGFFTFDLQSRARLAARIIEALKKGRACSPFWGRGSELDEDATRKNQVRLCPGFKVWSPGEYAVFLNFPASIENFSVLVNCGGSASGNWIADSFFSNGSQDSTTHPVRTKSIKVVNESGVEVDGYEPAPEDVYQSWRRIDTANPINYLFSNLNPSEEYLIRLHFADNQTSWHHNVRQNVHVHGLTTVSRVVAPATDYGEYSALIHEVRMRPRSIDRSIQIEVEPLTSSVCGEHHGIINAIEIHSIRWEVRRLLPGTNSTRLLWGDRLKGVYQAGSLVYPILFGKPIVSEIDALTNWHADARIGIQEPLGEGKKATPGLCPVEVCEPEFPLYQNGETPTDAVVSGCSGIGDYVESEYVWGLTQDTNPNTALTTGQIACHKALFEIEKQNLIDANPGATFQWGTMFWVWSDINGVRKSMFQKWSAGVCDPNNPEGDQSISFNGYMTLSQGYCQT